MEPFQPKKILVPTDFSDLSTRALEYAKRIAERFESHLKIIYADRFGPPDYLEIPPEYMEGLPALKEEVEKRLQEWVREHLPHGLTVDASVVADFPVPAILSVSRSEDVDLIVMGTHGRSGWRRALLGSVTEPVLRASERPVLTVLAPEDDSSQDVSISRVLCPVNFSEVAHLALDHASALACAFDAELVILHVLESPEQVEQADVLEQLQGWIAPEIRDRCDYHELVLSGHPAEQTLEFAKQTGVDLITIGAQHRKFFDTTVIGTTTEKITRHAYCPVLTVSRRLVTKKSEEKVREHTMQPVSLLI